MPTANELGGSTEGWKPLDPGIGHELGDESCFDYPVMEYEIQSHPTPQGAMVLLLVRVARPDDPSRDSSSVRLALLDQQALQLAADLRGNLVPGALPETRNVHARGDALGVARAPRRQLERVRFTRGATRGLRGAPVPQHRPSQRASRTGQIRPLR